jgi:hypothetical protein
MVDGPIPQRVGWQGKRHLDHSIPIAWHTRYPVVEEADVECELEPPEKMMQRIREVTRMGWLKRLLGTPDAPGHATDLTRPARQGSSAGQPYVPAPPEQPVDPSWTVTAPTLRPEGHLRVVGESYRQDGLRRVLAGVGPHRLVMAQLVRDRTNPHHGGAVAVFVGTDHVGYISRNDLGYEGYEGQSLYKALARLNERGSPATCWARVNGGTPGKPSIGISLFTGGYERPDKPYPFPVTVPPDSFATVLGVETHQDLLAGLLNRQDEATLSARLTVVEINPARPKAGGPVLLTAINGVIVGGLSPKESAARIPIVNELESLGFEAHALARLRRSTGQRAGVICSVSTLVLDR